MSSRQKTFNDYDSFVDKFKPKLTTDDCYTPEPVYAAVMDWACRRYGIDPSTVVRPFWPGSDYQAFDYPDGCTVIDNPPFSIIKQIKAWYLERGIRFFLFAPTLTLFSGADLTDKLTHISTAASITYANGAKVNTSFVTNLGGDVVVMSSPSLCKAVTDADEYVQSEGRREVPKYEYPDEVCTSAMVSKYSKYGIDFAVRRRDCSFIRSLDSQKAVGKAVFGGASPLREGSCREGSCREGSCREGSCPSLAPQRARAEDGADDGRD